MHFFATQRSDARNGYTYPLGIFRFAAVFGILSLLLLSGARLYAQDPAWLQYQRGRAAYEQGELGLALRYFRAAVALQPVFPEAEAGMGDILAEEGALGPALRHLQSALDQAHAFTVPDEQFLVRYRMAEIHRLRNDQREYERALERIVDHDPRFRSGSHQGERSARQRIYFSAGFDRMLELYRLEQHPAVNAHRLLGAHYLGLGEYEAAFNHLLAAALQVSTRLIEELRKRRPVYEYEGSIELVESILSDRELHMLLDELHYFETLYLLAAATYGVQPDSPQSQLLWRLLADQSAAGIWSRRSREQLTDPRADAVVDYL